MFQAIKTISTIKQPSDQHLQHIKQNNKMENKLSAASIYHDLQKGIYYRIDKRTGRTERSHKNGTLLKAFKLDISGNDYKKRRQEQDLLVRPHIRKKNILPSQRPTQAASEKFFSPSPFQQNKEMRPSHSNQLEPIRPRSIINSERMKSQQSEANFLTNFHPTLDPQPHSIVELRQSNPISSVLQCYSKLSEQKVNENHCWLDKAAGTIIAPPVLNSRGFRETKNLIYQPSGGVRKQRPQLRAVSQQSEQKQASWGRQLSKQKLLFLQFHPDLQERQNTKALNEHVERKKNIKKLEELFLEQTAKVTSHIYT